MNQNVDRPIETERDDRLLRRDLVVRLLGALIEPGGRATGVVLGLAGPGGAGKSSILNMVAEMAEVRHPSAVVVTFNPWLATSRTGWFPAFLSRVTAAREAGARARGCVKGERLRALGKRKLKAAKAITL